MSIRNVIIYVIIYHTYTSRRLFWLDVHTQFYCQMGITLNREICIAQKMMNTWSSLVRVCIENEPNSKEMTTQFNSSSGLLDWFSLRYYWKELWGFLRSASQIFSRSLLRPSSTVSSGGFFGTYRGHAHCGYSYYHPIRPCEARNKELLVEGKKTTKNRWWMYFLKGDTLTYKNKNICSRKEKWNSLTLWGREKNEIM